MTDQHPAILEIEELAKTFRVGFWRRKVEAVRGVSFEVREGEIFGLVGPNGAGKTTTMQMVVNLVIPDRGSARLFGESVRDPAVRRRVGYLPEQPYFYEHLTARELLQYYGSLHGMAGDPIASRIDELLELVDLEDAQDRPLREFSKGMRQRAGIAQALINDPDFVILDEPQSGLDPRGRKEVRDLIYRLRDQGKTVLFSSHILVDVEAVCDRVAVLDEGELARVTDFGDISEPERQQVEIVVVDLSSQDVAHLDRLRETERRSGELLLRFDGDVQLPALLERLEDLGGTIRSARRRSGRLEDEFLEQTVDLD